jgi:hypothetical protein
MRCGCTLCSMITKQQDRAPRRTYHTYNLIPVNTVYTQPLTFFHASLLLREKKCRCCSWESCKMAPYSSFHKCTSSDCDKQTCMRDWNGGQKIIQPLVQEVIEAAGHLCLFLSKFHCELNYIEFFPRHVEKTPSQPM